MRTSDLSTVSVWNVLFVVSACALLGGIAFQALTPHTLPPVVYASGSDMSADQANNVAAKARKRIEAKMWDLNSQELGGSVLSTITSLAEQNHLQLADFRIDKTLEVSGQREAPFVVVLDGDFKDFMKVLSALEGEDSKLAPTMLQLAESDRGAGFVKATVSLTAFLRKDS